MLHGDIPQKQRELTLKVSGDRMNFLSYFMFRNVSYISIFLEGIS